MRHPPRVVLVLAAAVAAVSAWAAWGLAERPALAVRFAYDDNASADDARIADGIAIEITRLLAQIDGLDVRAAVRASRYREARQDTHVFGAERGARLVLEGLVLIDDGVVRQIRTSLVSTTRRTVLWSRDFTPSNRDIFAVDRAIVAALAEALGLQLRASQRQDSLDPALQTTFLRARALQAYGGNISRPEAVDLFEQVTRQAPTFNPGFAALATARGGYLSIAGPPTVDPAMAAAARAAYAADAQLAEANVAMGLLSARLCRWARADEYFAEAIAIEPSVTAAHTDYVISTLLPLGRIDDALGVLNAAMASAPASVDVRRTLAYVQLQNNDVAGALDTTQWVIRHHPAEEFADQSRGRALYLSRRIDDARAWFNNSDSQWGHQGYVLALMGRHEEARALAEAHPGEPARQLLVYAGLNDVERALDALRRTALDNPWRALVWMRWPEIEPAFRGDPRAAALQEQLLRCPV